MSANNHNDWEDDAVWKLLDDAPPAKASPFFSRNVLREIRLAEHRPTPWWKRLIAPLPLTSAAVAAAAAFVVLVVLERPDTPIADTPTASDETFDVTQCLLIAAVEDPSLFSDEEVLALLY